MGISLWGEGLSLFLAAFLPKPAGWILRAASHGCTGLPKAWTGSNHQQTKQSSSMPWDTCQLKARNNCLGYHYKHQAEFLLGVSFPVQSFQIHTPHAQAFVMALCTTRGGGICTTPSGTAFSPSSLRLIFHLAFPHLPVSWVSYWNTQRFSQKLMQNRAVYWKNTTQRDFIPHGCFFCLHKRPSLGALLVLLVRQDFDLISWKMLLQPRFPQWQITQ